MKYATPLLFLILILAACRKKSTTEIKPKTLYVMTNESVAGKTIIRYFVNGTTVTIGDGSTVSNYGHDMDVSGTDVYILTDKVITSTGTRSHVITKNGIEIQSFPASASFYPNCIAVSGTDIYLGGVGQDPGSSNSNVKVWKNGTVSNITTGTQYSCRVWDMVVNGSDVYLAGYEADQASGYRSAKYWKNTAGITIATGSASTDGEIHRILINGNDVYCSGMINDKATVWKNGTATQLTGNDSYCYGIAVSGNDVYTAGAVDNGTIYKATYWKNGAPTTLDQTNSFSGAYSSVFGIAVDGSDTYVIGDILLPSGNYKAVYWKNGVETVLVNSAGTNASAYRMVLK